MWMMPQDKVLDEIKSSASLSLGETALELLRMPCKPDGQLQDAQSDKPKLTQRFHFEQSLRPSQEFRDHSHLLLS